MTDDAARSRARSSCWSACSASRRSSRSSPARCACRTRSRWSSPGCIVGIGASVAGFPPIDVSPELVLLVLLPGLVFEAAYRLRIAELRRWFGGLALLAIPGVAHLGRHRRRSS